MNYLNCVIEALEELGENESYNTVKKWIKNRYNINVSDSTFYRARNLFKQQNNKMLQERATESVVEPSESVKIGDEVTVEELRQMANFINEIGGFTRAKLVLDTLISLGNVRG